MVKSKRKAYKKDSTFKRLKVEDSLMKLGILI